MPTATECPYLHEKEIVSRLGMSMTDIDAFNGTPGERKSKLCKLLMQHLQKEGLDAGFDENKEEKKEVDEVYKNGDEVVKCISELLQREGNDTDILKKHAINIMKCMTKYKSTTYMQRIIECLSNEIRRLPSQSLMMHLKFLNSCVKIYDNKAVIPCTPNSVFILKSLASTDSDRDLVYNLAFVVFNPIRTRIESKREADHVVQAQRTRLRVQRDSYGSSFNQDDILNENSATYYSPYFVSSWKRQTENTKNSFKYNHLRIFAYTYDTSRNIVKEVTDLVHFMKNFGQVEEVHQAEFNTAFRSRKDNKNDTQATEAFGPEAYDMIRRKLSLFNVGQKTGLGNLSFTKSLFSQRTDGYNWYYKDDKIYGPYNTEKMHTMWSNKTINDNTLVGVTNLPEAPHTFIKYFHYPQLLNVSEITETGAVKRVKKFLKLQNTLEIDDLKEFYTDISFWCKYWLENNTSSPLELDMKYGLIVKEKANAEYYKELNITKYRHFKEHIFSTDRTKEIEIKTYDFVMFRGEGVTLKTPNSVSLYLLDKVFTFTEFIMAFTSFVISVIIKNGVLRNNPGLAQDLHTSLYSSPSLSGAVGVGQQSFKDSIMSPEATEDGAIPALKTGMGIFTSLGSLILSIFMFFVRCSWSQSVDHPTIEAFEKRNIEEFEDNIRLVIFTNTHHEIFQSNKFWTKPVTKTLKGGLKIISNAKTYLQSYSLTTSKEEYYYKDPEYGSHGPFTLTEIFNMYKTQDISCKTLIGICKDAECPDQDSDYVTSLSFSPLENYKEITGYTEWFYYQRSSFGRLGKSWRGPYTLDTIKHLLRMKKIETSTMIKKQNYTIDKDYIGNKKEIVHIAAEFSELQNIDSQAVEEPKFCMYGSETDEVRAAIIPQILSSLSKGFVNMKSLQTEFSQSMSLLDILTPQNPIISFVVDDTYLKMSDLKKKKIYQTYKNLSWIPHCVEYGGTFCPPTLFTDSSSLRVNVDDQAYFEFSTDNWALDAVLKLSGSNRIPKQKVLQATASILDTTQTITNHIEDFELQLPEHIKILYRVAIEQISQIEQKLQYLVNKTTNLIHSFIVEITGGNIDNKLIKKMRNHLKTILKDRLSSIAVVSSDIAKAFVQRLQRFIKDSLEDLVLNFPVLKEKIKDIAAFAGKITSSGVESAWYGAFNAWSGQQSFTIHDYSKQMINDLVAKGESVISNIYQDNWRHKIFISKAKRWEVMRLNFMNFYNKQNTKTQSVMKTMMYIFLPEAPEKMGRRYDLTSLGLAYEDKIVKHFPILGDWVKKSSSILYKKFVKILSMYITQQFAAVNAVVSEMPIIGKYIPKMNECSLDRLQDLLHQKLHNLPSFYPGLARYLLWDNMNQTWQWSDVNGPLVLGNQIYSSTLTDSFDPDLICQITPFPISNSEYQSVIDFYINKKPKNGMVFKHTLKEDLFKKIFDTKVFSIDYDKIIRGYHEILHMSTLSTSDGQNAAYISDVETAYVPTLKSIRDGVHVSPITVILMLPKIRGVLQFVNDNATSLFLSVYLATMTSNNKAISGVNTDTFLAIKKQAVNYGQVEIESFVRMISEMITRFMNPEGMLFILRYVTLCVNHIFVNMLFELTVTGSAMDAMRPSEGPFLELQFYNLSDSLAYTPTPYYKQKNGIELIKHCIDTVNKRYAKSAPGLAFTIEDKKRKLKLDIDFKNKIITVPDEEGRKGIFDRSRTYYEVHFLQIGTTSKERHRIVKVSESFNGTVELEDGTVFLNPKCVVDYNQLIAQFSEWEVLLHEEPFKIEKKENVFMEPVTDLQVLKTLSTRIDYAMYDEIDVEDIPLCATPLPLSLMILIENGKNFEPTIYASHFLECITLEFLYSNNKKTQYILRSHVTNELITGTDKALQLNSEKAFVTNKTYEWWVSFGKLYVKHLETDALYICKQIAQIDKEIDNFRDNIEKKRKILDDIEATNDKNERTWQEIAIPDKNSIVVVDDTFITEYAPENTKYKYVKDAPDIKDLPATVLLNKKYQNTNVRLDRPNIVIECSNRYFKKIFIPRLSAKEVDSEIKKLNEDYATMTLFWADKLVPDESPFVIDSNSKIIRMTSTPNTVSVNGVLYTNFVNLKHQLFIAKEFMDNLNASYTRDDEIYIFESNGQRISSSSGAIHTLNKEYYKDDLELVLLTRFIKHQEFRLKMMSHYNSFVNAIINFKAVASAVETGIHYMKYFHFLSVQNGIANTSDFVLGKMKNALGSDKFIFTSPSGQIITSDEAHMEGNYVKLSLSPVDPITQQPDVIVPNLYFTFDPPNFKDKVKQDVSVSLDVIFSTISSVGQEFMNKTEHMKIHAKNMFEDNMMQLKKLSQSIVS